MHVDGDHNLVCCLYRTLVLSLRTDDPLMGKLRTKSYILRDGQEVTCRSVAAVIGISLSAARGRLNRSDDPKKIFAPYSISNGGKPKKIKKPFKEKVLMIDDPMYILAFGGAEAYKRAIEKQNA